MVASWILAASVLASSPLLDDTSAPAWRHARSCPVVAPVSTWAPQVPAWEAPPAWRAVHARALGLSVRTSRGFDFTLELRLGRLFSIEITLATLRPTAFCLENAASAWALLGGLDAPYVGWRWAPPTVKPTIMAPWLNLLRRMGEDVEGHASVTMGVSSSTQWNGRASAGGYSPSSSFAGARPTTTTSVAAPSFSAPALVLPRMDVNRSATGMSPRR